ncbi:MAG: hypothetical protein HZA34_02515 [Candidatus Pacebacteria bacterium]|nr:hypothetical protein [Candidatus Paceibacterota bacterium]
MKIYSDHIPHTIFQPTRGMTLYFYDISKLFFGGFFLTGILQGYFFYAMMGIILSILVFVVAKYLEVLCGNP